MKREKRLTLEELKKVNRPLLGERVSLLIFRLLRFSGMREILGESTDHALYILGKHIGRRMETSTLGEVINFLKEENLGLPILVKKERRKIVISLKECASCAGIPVLKRKVCSFEAGLIAGALEMVYGQRTKAKETKCYVNGDEVCEFEIVVF